MAAHAVSMKKNTRPSKMEAAWAQATEAYELMRRARFSAYKAGADEVHMEAMLAHMNAAAFDVVLTPAPDLDAVEEKASMGQIHPRCAQTALREIFADLRRIQGKRKL